MDRWTPFLECELVLGMYLHYYSFSLLFYSILIQNSTGTELRGTIWAADTCQCSWTLKEAMSQLMEHDSTAKQSSQNDSESNSKSETESEEGPTAFEDDTFLSIQFPSPPNFHTPYLHNRDFLNAERARKYIMKHFNIENIREGLQRYPDLSKDVIYHNTFIAPEHFESLQHYIKKSIHDRNAALQIWSENIARYLVSDNLNPLLILNVL